MTPPSFENITVPGLPGDGLPLNLSFLKQTCVLFQFPGLLELVCLSILIKLFMQPPEFECIAVPGLPSAGYWLVMFEIMVESRWRLIGTPWLAGARLPLNLSVIFIKTC